MINYCNTIILKTWSPVDFKPQRVFPLDTKTSAFPYTATRNISSDGVC